MSAGDTAGVRLKIERRNGRIYFGEGEHEWSCWDPAEGPRDSTEARSIMGYLACVCPTTKLATEKLRLIRWAVRNVRVSPPATPTPGGKL